jgi:NAD-dependent deacetylase
VTARAETQQRADETPRIDGGLIDLLRSRPPTLVVTGAGVSAESGIPTFRDAMTGLWSRYRAEELASPDGFRRDPALVWEWYEWRRHLVRSTRPNAGHHALAELQRLNPDTRLVTQNVDGLHQLAGSTDVIELHGNLFSNRCLEDGGPVPEDSWTSGTPPKCPRCGGPVRPAVVWFGEMLPADALAAAQDAAARCGLFFSVGTSSLVYPAAQLAEIALDRGAVIVEVNPEPTPLTPRSDYVIPHASGLALPALVQRMATH